MIWDYIYVGVFTKHTTQALQGGLEAAGASIPAPKPQNGIATLAAQSSPKTLHLTAFKGKNISF